MRSIQQTLNDLYEEFEMLLDEGEAAKAALVLDIILESSALVIEICEDEALFAY